MTPTRRMRGGSLAFSVKDRRWCGQLLEALDIREDLFPAVRRPYDMVGKVTEEAAESLVKREEEPARPMEGHWEIYEEMRERFAGGYEAVRFLNPWSS